MRYLLMICLDESDEANLPPIWSRTRSPGSRRWTGMASASWAAPCGR